MDASIVIRTLNEGRWLPDLLEAVKLQNFAGSVETVIVDSGSTDDTLEIAEKHQCRIVRIKKADFTFGRSLNVGCEAAQGECLVFISGHCIPVGRDWLGELIRPLREGEAEYVYGRQEAHALTKFSERQLFRKYFPEESCVPQQDIFCNNANSALLKSVWMTDKFDETLTGLEDMEMAKRLVATGRRIGYVASASVYHIHEEQWRHVQRRYEREAVALQGILPDVRVTFGDFIRYFVAGVMLDWSQALQEKAFRRYAAEVLMFRLMQYWGTYRGNNEHRRITQRRKEAYFYPR